MRETTSSASAVMYCVLASLNHPTRAADQLHR
jgi:hypothetical protein